ncbi:2066_t:CDS:2, partial [Scutellospora calospora]
MASDDKFDEADLCFISNVETNIFDEILNSYGQLRSEESNSLVESEAKAKTDLTDSEEGLYSLTKGQISVLINESWLDKYSHERGFAFSLVKSELDKNDGIPRHRVYYCSKGHRYEAKKKAHILEERNKAHENSGCEYHLNFQRWKSNNQVHISDIIGEHSHPISDNIQMAVSKYHRLISEIQDDIELLAASGVRTGAIINLLTQKYPDQYIYTHSVYNVIQVAKAEKRKLSDASATYKELMHRKQEMPSWYVDAKFEGSDNHL